MYRKIESASRRFTGKLSCPNHSTTIPAQTVITPAQRVGYTFSPRINRAANAPTTKPNADAGKTKLTGCQLSKDKNEKNAQVSSVIPSHSHGTRTARQATASRARGVNRVTSPIFFMACD